MAAVQRYKKSLRPWGRDGEIQEGKTQNVAVYFKMGANVYRVLATVDPLSHAFVGFHPDSRNAVLECIDKRKHREMERCLESVQATCRIPTGLHVPYPTDCFFVEPGDKRYERIDAERPFCELIHFWESDRPRFIRNGGNRS